MKGGWDRVREGEVNVSGCAFYRWQYDMCDWWDIQRRNMVNETKEQRELMRRRAVRVWLIQLQQRLPVTA